MGGGSNNQGTQVNSQEPWGPYGNIIENKVLPDAKKAYNKGKGFDVFGGDWYVGPSGETNQALSGIANLAKQGNPLSGQSMDVASGLMSGQFDPSTSQYDDLYGALGGLGNDATGYANDARTNLEALMGRSNEEAFNAALDTQMGKLGDDITRQFGGSSFGSSAHSGTLVDQIGDARTAAAAKYFGDQYNRDANTLAQMRGVDQGLLGTQAGLMGQQGGLLGQKIGAEQMGVQNRLAGLSAAPGAYESQFAGLNKLGEVGAAREGYDAAQLQGEMDKFNAKQASKLAPMEWLSGMVGGAGGYGTTTSTVSTPSSPFASALGGGILGGQVGGPLGAGIGGLLGFLS